MQDNKNCRHNKPHDHPIEIRHIIVIFWQGYDLDYAQNTKDNRRTNEYTSGYFLHIYILANSTLVQHR